MQVVLANGSLVLLTVEPSDKGQYMCRLANVAGMIYHNILLNVQSMYSYIGLACYYGDVMLTFDLQLFPTLWYNPQL